MFFLLLQAGPRCKSKDKYFLFVKSLIRDKKTEEGLPGLTSKEYFQTDVCLKVKHRWDTLLIAIIQ